MFYLTVARKEKFQPTLGVDFEVGFLVNHAACLFDTRALGVTLGGVPGGGLHTHTVGALGNLPACKLY